MLTTENFAKTQWCPYAKSCVIAHARPVGGVNRAPGGGAEDNCHCIASACMAWRWADPVPVLHRKWIEANYELCEDGYTRRIGADGYWVVNKERPKHVPASYELVDCPEDGWGWQEPEAEAHERQAREIEARCGYCGAFGKPEHV